MFSIGMDNKFSIVCRNRINKMLFMLMRFEIGCLNIISFIKTSKQNPSHTLWRAPRAHKISYDIVDRPNRKYSRAPVAYNTAWLIAAQMPTTRLGAKPFSSDQSMQIQSFCSCKPISTIVTLSTDQHRARYRTPDVTAVRTRLWNI